MVEQIDVPRSFKLDQRNKALAKGNEIRIERAQIKKDLKARKITFQALLEYPPDSILDMPVLILVQAIPYFGISRINRVVRTCRISHRRTVSDLTERERTQLIAVIEKYLPSSVR